MLFDNLFNIILLTVLLNVTAGIIIDTFASLRERDRAKEEDMTNVCFICNIERSEFDRAARTTLYVHAGRLRGALRWLTPVTWRCVRIQ